jgi:hypothetical protein
MERVGLRAGLMPCAACAAAIAADMPPGPGDTDMARDGGTIPPALRPSTIC